MTILEQARKRFQKDIYATETTGIKIADAAKNYAKCTLDIDNRHLNAANIVMGGALFTLADFTFAVAANTENPLTVSLTSQITYLSATKGTHLTAEAKCDKAGRRTCSFTISIVDEFQVLIATVTGTGMRVE